MEKRESARAGKKQDLPARRNTSINKTTAWTGRMHLEMDSEVTKSSRKDKQLSWNMSINQLQLTSDSARQQNWNQLTFVDCPKTIRWGQPVSNVRRL